MKRQPIHFRNRLSGGIALILSASLLGGCASGGSDYVRPNPPPVQPSAPSPNPSTPPPVTGPLVVNGPGSVYQQTSVNGDVQINAGGDLGLDANVSGSVSNNGRMEVFDPSAPTEFSSHVRIGGNYVQGDGATLVVHLYKQEASDLRIAGNASLDGTLKLALSWFGSTYSNPSTILHADGGIVGQFDKVESPSVFLSSSINYGTHDVILSLAPVTATSIAGASTDNVTLAGATGLDGVIGRVGWNGAPSPAEATQHALAASLATLWQIRDAAQATRSFDSLSGQAYASTRAWLLDGGDAAGLRGELPARQPGNAVNAWWRNRSASNAHADAGAMAAQAQSEGSQVGLDRWFGERWLLGIAAGDERTRADFARGGDRAQWRQPSAVVYAQYRHGAWHATGVIGQSQARLEMQRWIDLGAGGRHLASTTLGFERFDASFEAGRQWRIGNAMLMPYLAANRVALRSDGFIERGDTGFELTAAPGRLVRTSADFGLRFAHAWRWGGDRLIAMRVDGGWKRYLDRADPWQASYTGLPTLRFELPEPATGPGQQYLDLRFESAGRRETDWSAFLRGNWTRNDIERGLAWQFGMQKRF